MLTLAYFLENIISPPILFFLLGLLAGFLKSDLSVPDSISRYLSLYLMMAIGFKGGVAIANAVDLNATMLFLGFLGLGMSFFQPFLGYALLRSFTALDRETAAAVAAHYGSISIVTFAAASTFLKAHGGSYSGIMVALLALMEAPAILSGLFIAHRRAPATRSHRQEEKQLGREIFTNGAILLLLGSLVIGWATGKPGLDQVQGFLVDPFQGILCLFLLDMGLLVSKNRQHLSQLTWPLIAFGLYMPCLGAGLAYGLTLGLGLGPGDRLLFVVLCASASYIAVPAAMRLALPEARSAIYIPMSIALTFPFNVMIGIPLYWTWIHG